MKEWWAKVPDRWKAALHTAWQTALGAFIPSLFGFLSQVQEWAGDTSKDFPSVNPLGKAAMAAVAGGFALLVNLAFRAFKPPPAYQGSVPKVVPPAADGGHINRTALSLALCMITVLAGVIVLLFGLGAFHEPDSTPRVWSGVGLICVGLAGLVNG